MKNLDHTFEIKVYERLFYFFSKNLFKFLLNLFFNKSIGISDNMLRVQKCSLNFVLQDIFYLIQRYFWTWPHSYWPEDGLNFWIDNLRKSQWLMFDTIFEWNFELRFPFKVSSQIFGNPNSEIIRGTWRFPHEVGVVGHFLNFLGGKWPPKCPLQPKIHLQRWKIVNFN